MKSKFISKISKLVIKLDNLFTISIYDIKNEEHTYTYMVFKVFTIFEGASLCLILLNTHLFISLKSSIQYKDKY